jgi:iron complex outermembrane receptor protein
VQNSVYLGFFPLRRTLEWYNVFVQDEIAIRRDLSLTIGAKVEHNVYTGAEVLPYVRLGWQLAPSHLVWGSIARAVRAPARIERDFYSPADAPIIRGGPDFESEVANVMEVGYRGRISPAVTLSTTLFYHDHDRLRSLEPDGGGLVFRNGIRGRTTGLESWATWQVTRDWRLYGGLTLLDQDLRTRAGVIDAGGLRALGNDPSHWWKLRSLWNVTPQHTFDVAIRRVGALPEPRVPAYTAVSARFGWQVSRELDLAIVAENLFDPRHPEWGPAENRVEHERSVFLQLVWRP